MVACLAIGHSGGVAVEFKGVNDGVRPVDIAQADGSPCFTVVVGVDDGGSAVVVYRYRIDHRLVLTSFSVQINPAIQMTPACQTCHVMMATGVR